MNKTTICKRIKAEPPEKHVTKTAAKFIHKHLHHQKCPSMMNELIIPKRAASMIYLKNPLNGTYPGSLDKLIQIHNKLPQNVKAKNPNQLKRYLKKNDVPT